MKVRLTILAVVALMGSLLAVGPASSTAVEIASWGGYIGIDDSLGCVAAGDDLQFTLRFNDDEQGTAPDLYTGVLSAPDPQVPNSAARGLMALNNSLQPVGGQQKHKYSTKWLPASGSNEFVIRFVIPNFYLSQTSFVYWYVRGQYIPSPEMGVTDLHPAKYNFNDKQKCVSP